MNNILKRGLGKLQSIITRGFGKTLIIVTTPDVQQPAGIVKPAKFWDTIQRYIRTRKIKIPDEEDEITCDVVLINPNDLGIMSDAILLSKKYTEVKVYKINEVKLK